MNRLIHTKYGYRTSLPVAWVLPVVVAAIASAAPPAVAAAQTDQGRLATAAELRQIRDAGQYRICLQQIGRVLRSSSVDKAYDRYDLLLLRGDCLLHLEDAETAQLAYEAAAKSPVPAQAREGRATALLLRRSTRMTYVPRGDGDEGESIDLASKEGRTKALGALLQNELRASEPDIRRAANAGNLVPIRDVLPRLADLYAVERTATGGDTHLRPVLEAIGQRARTLIDHELDVREQSITALETRANQRVDVVVGGWWGGNVRRGLHSTDRRELRDLIDFLQRVEETAGLGQQLADSFDGDAKLWDSSIYQASKAVRRARDVLEAE